MTKPGRRWWFNSRVIVGYAVAVGLVVAALFALQLLETYFVTAPASVFVCAAMFSGWFGGFGPALFATLLAFLAFDYYYVAPIYSFSLDVTEIPHILVFLLATLLLDY